MDMGYWRQFALLRYQGVAMHVSKRQVLHEHGYAFRKGAGAAGVGHLTGAS